MVLTGLRPRTDYHFRIKAWDGSGSLGASGDFTFSTIVRTDDAGGRSGRPTQPIRIRAPGRAYQYIATQSGQASIVRLFIDSGTSARSSLRLYSDQNGSPAVFLTRARRFERRLG